MAASEGDQVGSLDQYSGGEIHRPGLLRAWLRQRPVPGSQSYDRNKVQASNVAAALVETIC
jgi:hypothetical protein